MNESGSARGARDLRFFRAPPADIPSFPPLPIMLRAAPEAAVAQLVEHVIRNDGVGGSSPFCGTTFQSGVGQMERLRF